MEKPRPLVESFVSLDLQEMELERIAPAINGLENITRWPTIEKSSDTWIWSSIRHFFWTDTIWWSLFVTIAVLIRQYDTALSSFKKSKLDMRYELDENVFQSNSYCIERFLRLSTRSFIVTGREFWVFIGQWTWEYNGLWSEFWIMSWKKITVYVQME